MIPGIDGSLGQCGYCGESFVSEILLGESVKTVRLGGVEIPLHKDCFFKMMALGVSGRVAYDSWRGLPEKSPLREELKRLEAEYQKSEKEEPS